LDSEKSKGTLIIRADSTSGIGTGHIMRCIALGQAWQKNAGYVLFVSHCENKKLQRRILEEGFGFVSMEQSHPDPDDLKQVLSILQNVRNSDIESWLVLDGYHFDPDYQRSVRECGYRLLLIDDYNHLCRYHADIILNQNIHAELLNYTCDDDTMLLLGLKYVMLRNEFLDLEFKERHIPDVARRILVTLGGADKENVTLKVICALNRLKLSDLETKVIVGPANPHRRAIEEELERTQLSYGVFNTAENMSSLMSWADLAVSGGGSTCWELAYIGVPSVIMVLSENQQNVASGLDRVGVAKYMGYHSEVKADEITRMLKRLIFDREKRLMMSTLGRGLVTGSGRKRVIEAMDHTAIFLREVKENDCRLLWEWANDRFTRAMSFNSKPISLKTHEDWFYSKIRDPKCFFLIAENKNGRPIGQIRFDPDGDEALVSVSLEPKFRGYGLGGEFIRRACGKFIDETKVEKIRALIKKSNKASIGAFEKGGFSIVDHIFFKGSETVVLRYSKQEDK
jgi:UDP-2,4-diacetamido-2,4,6-trideoxy-beta-L-altropyranose hydrolase